VQGNHAGAPPEAMKRMKFIASLAATAGLAVTVYAVWLVYRYRLYEFSDADGLISKHDSYVWAAGALLSLCGYVGLALTFDARTALRKGGTALWASMALLVLVFVIPIVNKEDWTGASFLMLLFLEAIAQPSVRRS
jgi:hypothetical protein